MPQTSTDCESICEAPNPIGMNGIEYLEYTTTQPQALSQVLEQLGFKPVARHRSREVLLYRQGEMNIVVSAHVGVVRGTRPLRRTPALKARPGCQPWRCAFATPGPPTNARWNWAPGTCPTMHR